MSLYILQLKLKEKGGISIIMLFEQSFESLFNNSVDSIVIVDVENERIISANKVFCQMTGFNQEKTNNLAFKDLYRQEDLAGVIEQFRLQAAGELSIAKDLPFRREDGSIFFADITSFNIYFENKRYMVAIFRDVTDQKQIEEELSFKNITLKTQVEMSPDGILVLDEKGISILANKRVYDMWDMPQKLRDNYDYEEHFQHIT